MILNLSPAARDALAAALQSQIDGAGPGAHLMLYEGPAKLLCIARLPLACPCGTVADGVLTISPIAEATAIGTGRAGWAQIVDVGAATVLECDVGTGGEAIALNAVDILLGGPVKIDSLVITAPE